MSDGTTPDSASFHTENDNLNDSSALNQPEHGSRKLIYYVLLTVINALLVVIFSLVCLKYFSEQTPTVVADNQEIITGFKSFKDTFVALESEIQTIRNNSEYNNKIFTKAVEDYDELKFELKSKTANNNLLHKENKKLEKIVASAKDLKTLYETLMTLDEIDKGKPDASVKKVSAIAAAIALTQNTEIKSAKLYDMLIKLTETLAKGNDPDDQVNQIKKAFRKLIDAIKLPDK